MCQQRQRDVAIPALPTTYFVLIEATLALGGLESDLDFPSPARDADYGLSGDLAPRRIDDVVRMLAFVVEATPNQQVVSKAALFIAQLQPP
jgi:hypothetical protein